MIVNLFVWWVLIGLILFLIMFRTASLDIAPSKNLSEQEGKTYIAISCLWPLVIIALIGAFICLLFDFLMIPIFAKLWPVLNKEIKIQDKEKQS